MKEVILIKTIISFSKKGSSQGTQIFTKSMKMIKTEMLYHPSKWTSNEKLKIPVRVMSGISTERQNGQLQPGPNCKTQRRNHQTASKWSASQGMRPTPISSTPR